MNPWHWIKVLALFGPIATLFAIGFGLAARSGVAARTPGVRGLIGDLPWAAAVTALFLMLMVLVQSWLGIQVVHSR